MNDKYLIVVEPVSTVSYELMRKIDELGIPTIAITPFVNDSHKIKSWLNRQDTIKFVYVNNYKVDEWIELLPPFEQIAGVLPGQELSVVRAAMLAEIINKGNYTSLEVAELCRYKDKMRLCLENAEIPIPKFEVITNKEEAKWAAEKIGYPCVVKPTDQASAFGVRLVNNFEELIKAIDFINSKRLYEVVLGNDQPRVPIRKEILIEEFITGPEFSIEMFLKNGDIIFSAVTEEETTPEFVEVGQCSPPLMYSSIENDMITFTKKVVQALKIKEGVSHCEVMLTKNGLKVIECANRMPGAHIIELHNNTYGIDIPKSLLLHSMGLPFTLEPKLCKGTAVKFIHFNCSGIIKSIDFERKEIMKLNGVLNYFFDLEKGKRVDTLKSSFEKYGSVICEGMTPKEAINNCNVAISYIKNRIKFE